MEQFEQVVACADQRPFAVHLLQSPQQELPESPALLDLAEYRLHSLHPQSVALPPAWSVTSVASGPWETDGWVCDLGARVAQPGRGGSAPGRRTGPRPEHRARRLPLPSNSQHRRILPWGLHQRCRCLLHHRRSLLLIRSLVGGPRRHDHLVSAVHHRLTVVRLQEVLASRCGDDARLGIGEVTLGLVVGHRVLTPSASACSAAACASASSAAMASRIFSNRPSRKANSCGNSSPRLSLPYRRSSSSETTPLPPPPTALPSPSSVGNSSPYASMRWP